MAESHEESSTPEPQRISGSRRTRSHGAPDWSLIESLILVNEIAAVEADCLKALSSYQKWMIIAENCTAQDVPRNFNQCRRKWDSLVLDYNKIKKWESKSRGASFWSLGSDRRQILGLPRDFDDELFLAIENLIMLRENQPDTDPDPDSDGEAKDDMVDAVKELGSDTLVYKQAKGSKRQRRRLTSLEKSSWKSVSKEISMKIQAERKPHNFHVEDNPAMNSMKESPVRSFPEVKPIDQTSMKRKPQTGNVVENESHETTKAEHKEQWIALVLRDNAEMVNSIVSQNAEYKVVKVENGEVGQTESAEFVRRQGDKLIACLGDIVKALGYLVQDCE